MSSNSVISAKGLSKEYFIYPTPASRLKQMIFGTRRTYYKNFTALEGLDFELEKGQVLGVVGRNGAGKSTLLQLLCGTLTPTSGQLQVTGRIAALLELGSGFNSEFSGRENIYMSAALMGLSNEEINQRIEDIIDFSGIRQFIDQPVKTYSSGMYVRLAFSVATSVDPDILVIDEALSVGDGDFAKKSFDRIMSMKAQGKTILFCSHALYQVETLCSQVIWLEAGKVAMAGSPSEVIPRYSSFLDSFTLENEAAEAAEEAQQESPGTSDSTAVERPVGDKTYVVNSSFEVPGSVGLSDRVISNISDVKLTVEFYTHLRDKTPQVAFVIKSEGGVLIASCGTWNDGFTPVIDKNGFGKVSIVYPKLSLLKGRYFVDVILFCENGFFAYEEITNAHQFDVIQSDQEMGLVRLEHDWLNVEKLA